MQKKDTVENKKKILLVDDAADYLSLLSGSLQGGFEVRQAMGVKGAIAILEKETVDLVCSNFYMGDGIGTEIFDYLRRNGRDIPFLLVSGSERNLDIRLAERQGAIFIPKEDVSQLMQTIRSYRQ